MKEVAAGLCLRVSDRIRLELSPEMKQAVLEKNPVLWTKKLMVNTRLVEVADFYLEELMNSNIHGSEYIRSQGQIGFGSF